MDMQFRCASNPCPEPSLMVEILQNDMTLTRGCVVDRSKNGLVIDTFSSKLGRQDVPFNRLQIVPNEDYLEEVQIGEEVEVLLRPSEDDIMLEQLHPGKLVDLRPYTGWFACGAWQLAVVEIEQQEKHKAPVQMLIEDGYGWKRRRLRRRRTFQPLQIDTFQKLNLLVPDKNSYGCIGSMLVRLKEHHSSFQSQWIIWTSSAFIAIGVTESRKHIEVICRSDMINFATEGINCILSQYRGESNDLDIQYEYNNNNKNLFFYGFSRESFFEDTKLAITLTLSGISHAIAARERDGDHGSEMIINLLPKELLIATLEHFDIYIREICRRVCRLWNWIFDLAILEKDIMIPFVANWGSESDIDHSFRVAVLVSKYVTVHTKTLYLTGSWNRCVLAASRILEYKKKRLNYLIVAGNEDLFLDNFIGCYRSFVVRTELLNAFEHVIIKACRITFWCTTLYELGTYGTIPQQGCTDTFDYDSKIPMPYLSISVDQHLDALEHTLQILEYLENACPDLSAAREKWMRINMQRLEEVGAQHYKLLEIAFEKYITSVF